MRRLWQVVLAALTPPPKKAPDRDGFRDGPSGPASPKGVTANGPAPTAGREAKPPRRDGSGGSARKWVFALLRHKMVILMVGGALGTAARYLLGKWFGAQPWAQGFPYGTLFINVTGSFILAVAGVIILERLPPEHQDWYLLIGTGFCGGYTTFSTFEWETFKLVRDGSWLLALGNVLGSVLAGFVGVLLGVGLAVVVFPKR